MLPISVDRATAQAALVTTIALPYSVVFNAAFLRSERLKLVYKGAVSENIETIVDAIIAMRVDGVAVK